MTASGCAGDLHVENLLGPGLGLAGTAAAGPTVLVGQVVCSQCWFEADRARVAYNFPVVLGGSTAQRDSLGSDRIGTPEGQACFATLSKNLESWTGLPVAPCVEVSYGTFENDLRGTGGLHTRFGRGFSSTVIHDGKQLHPTMEYRFLERHVITLLWVATEELGVSYSATF